MYVQIVRALNFSPSPGIRRGVRRTRRRMMTTRCSLYRLEATHLGDLMRL